MGEGSVVILSFAFLNGAVTVYGPWQRPEDAQGWARQNLRGSWSLQAVEAPVAA